MMGLYKVALSFRLAIEEAISAGDITDLNMLNFPTGCCGCVSNLLQRFLFERNIHTNYISGQYGSESHAWLETEYGIVIDITGDQYKYHELRFSKPVYVGKRNNGFHDKFNLDTPVPYCEWDESYGIGRKNKELYDAIMMHYR